MSEFAVAQIGVIRSPWKEKFAVPRQPGLVQDGGGELHLQAPYNQPEAVRGLEAFSHIWILFMFHQTMAGGWRPTVRPPRLGGNARMGVFATRSTFRPNPVGMSLVELKGIRCEKSQVILQLGSLDLVDGTPVIDIKPYLPFAEALPDARAGYAQAAPEATMPVRFSAAAQQQIQQQAHIPQLQRFITEVLAQDPRPAYRKGESLDREYAAWLLDFNVRWRIDEAGTEVIAVDPR
ncbi:tRNA (N6-threonylcarbamoyladenosine(37)-N6)-methyltransferase TrmO [Pantoea sp. ICBG 1758]|jgi:tRNA-Thr(GGU) m(6)t(6)A37 methyltransferase TsaA|uniref:tRNA (N6-threonylcarbamoyladenosine(37)-N6)-methyltransferase TrmO n=1 Tax=Pantoea TaxID=53335 RepID=UPI0008FD9171|nr:MULTISPECIES: tRNA (N6-threonylcarbamoyladenosine(37)-N6)-methyltransferase TrmO [Pantoea]KAA6045268.1 tRNA (N6-threonylcarbamoyladenosine(37)-N6)-methyltransferase TrmO [Pantoea sp. Bo_7]KAA6090616.1 tRNA (N6-threonylcarbamoyladenosine(37)-N6)-methyltransferase TrmO [Pantoea sp. Bo_10]MDJ0022890.1 tRNA (N6-threonylcarbamoyladenosine(37)-N6)-methyltransferase TrmO [Pantoea eucrina]OIX91617.1 tRNA (N6-threonylcarbamoyladenosine(37)-N6)-methyltransferase TrmO [Pantoea sp. Ae16]PPC62271.1 tRNA